MISISRALTAVVLLLAGAGPAFTQAGGCVGDEARTGLCIPGEVRSAPEPEPEKMSDEEIAKLPRDQRRTKYMEGFTCNRMIVGQSGYVKYLPGGVGLVGHQEGNVSFSWSIKNDELCYRSHRWEDKCQQLPKRDIPNEKEWLLGGLAKNCL